MTTTVSRRLPLAVWGLALCQALLVSGNILLIGDVYHWYGSTKKETVDPATGKPCRFDCSLGINVYTSTDLLSWAFGGVVFNSTQINVTAIAPPLAYTPPFRIERPKVIYNAATKNFVMWFHLDDNGYKVRERPRAMCCSGGSCGLAINGITRGGSGRGWCGVLWLVSPLTHFRPPPLLPIFILTT